MGYISINGVPQPEWAFADDCPCAYAGEFDPACTNRDCIERDRDERLAAGELPETALSPADQLLADAALWVDAALAEAHAKAAAR